MLNEWMSPQGKKGTELVYMKLGNTDREGDSWVMRITSRTSPSRESKIETLDSDGSGVFVALVLFTSWVEV